MQTKVLRRKKRANYEEFGSDLDEYIDIDGIKIALSTNKWDSETVDALNIVSENVDDLGYIFHGNLTLDDDKLKIVVPNWNGTKDSINDITPNRKLRTLLRKAATINSWQISGQQLETLVDGFTDSLLHILGFDDDPLGVYPQYEFSTHFEGVHEITSKPDFTVMKDEVSILVVIEDKTARNANIKNNWKEAQVMGEIFVAAHKLVSLGAFSTGVKYPISVYAVRIVGIFFTFYKSSFTEDYMFQDLNNLPLAIEGNVKRYPSLTDRTKINAFNFCIPSEREEIIRCMSHICFLISKD
ncbi:hypothetical protein CONCODRAFT_68505 [Conidiobolus coronatus NRRL 28638]|uniref:Fungal-type protein kinase domain-containing protein n=1 Tax=Conidiobolus coronatus (strain ATCC 28846 / CBS 209.66 / NRRL 28638) TaxID=796925 RepID=A0A137PEA4_CONC2|nr:hypothetical protein CONCODRAFT_68505 [Conidiobolus coronatus NRRL 28638]|eukprot:KXN73271.1 hypothetical protein CONCODRAFT_68505 [Conidiobolus coronatus NRRL 28638]